MTNYTDLTVDSLKVGTQDIPALETTQTLIDTGDITIKNGVVILNKSSAIAAALAAPTATTDDFKKLTIISITAKAHTVTPSTHFGAGGVNTVKSTFGQVIGNNIQLVAYQGYWYVVGGQGYTISS